MNMRSYNCGKINSSDIELLAGTLKIISEPNRLQILCALEEDGEHCVCELTERMLGISQSLISHHIADLRDAELIEGEKRGQKVYYKLTDNGRRITKSVLYLKKKGLQK